MPPGLDLFEGFISADEERALLAAIEELPFGEVRMHGVAARRTVVHFGWRYGYDSWSIDPGPALPSFLEPLRGRAAVLADVAPPALEEILVTRYPPGAGIGWHRDAPMFGPVVIGVSLASACRMRFRRGPPRAREVDTIVLPARSAYRLAGEARTQWQHSLPPVRDFRVSITFRTLRPS